MNNDMLLKIANIAKIAWTARDLNQPVWRRLGGFAIESTPWYKGFTPGLTQKIEGNIVSKLADKPHLLSKYTNMLSDRAKASYSGNNISRGLGDAPYRNLGKSIREVDPEKALAGIKRGTGNKIRAAKKVTPVEVGIDAANPRSEARRSISDGTIIEQRIKLTVPRDTSLNSRLDAAIINTHEGSELYRMKNPKYTNIGIGSHRSYSVLADEQKALRDVPGSLYKKLVDMRVSGPYADKRKLDILSKNHNINIREYGESLRTNKKKIKDIDNAANAQLEIYKKARPRYDAIYERAKDAHLPPERLKRIADGLNRRVQGTYTHPRHVF